MGVSYALYDEGAFRNELKGWDAANMKIAPESLRVVNGVLPESDRVKEMQKILKQIGVFSKFKNGKLLIKGKKFEPNKIRKVKVADLGDHRICMSAAILGLLTGSKVEIKNFETVGTSSPSFLKIITQIGGTFEKKKI